MVDETFEELKRKLKDYPSHLNKYINSETRDKLRKMGRLDEALGKIPNLDKLVESSVEYDITQLSVKELKDLAKKLKIKGYSSMSETKLIDSILKAR